MPIRQRFQKSDILWLLAYPVYQVIGRARQEGSHALVALAEGAKIEQSVVPPSLVGGQFFWGYVARSVPTDWVMVAVPVRPAHLPLVLVHLHAPSLQGPLGVGQCAHPGAGFPARQPGLCISHRLLQAGKRYRTGVAGTSSACRPRAYLA
jgi:hypothetical protein